MQLDELFDYKNRLVHDLLTNKEVVRLLDDDEEGIQNPEELVYTQVFPYEYVPEMITHGQTFICCDVDIQKVTSKTFLTPYLYIWVFTHKSKIRLRDSGVRTDRLCSEIVEAINGSRYYGLGELELNSARRFHPIDDYLGRVLTFNATDFNRLSPSGKSAPSNRKAGR